MLMSTIGQKFGVGKFFYVFEGSLLCSSRLHLKSSDAKASKCHLKFSSLMMIFLKLVYLSSVISLK